MGIKMHTIKQEILKYMNSSGYKPKTFKEISYHIQSTNNSQKIRNHLNNLTKNGLIKRVYPKRPNGKRILRKPRAKDGRFGEFTYILGKQLSKERLIKKLIDTKRI